MKDGDFVKFPTGEFKALSKDGTHWQFIDGQSYRNYNSDCARADRIGNMMAYPEKDKYLKYLRLPNHKSTATLPEWRLAINGGTTILDTKPSKE
jgi:hypothetical protein